MYRLVIRPILRGDMEFINWIFAIILIFMIFIFKKSFGAYNLFNINEDKLYCINENHLLWGWFKKASRGEQKIKNSFVRIVFRFADLSMCLKTH
jgi:hypothetical protein